MAEMTKNPPRRESDVQEQALLAAREEGLDEESEYEDDDGLSDQDSFTGRPTRHRSRSSEQSVDLYSPQEEMRVRRKLDIYLVLFVSLLYMMFVDSCPRHPKHPLIFLGHFWIEATSATPKRRGSRKASVSKMASSNGS
jgi:hypothetical protein